MRISKLFTKSETFLCLGTSCKHYVVLKNAKYAQTSSKEAQVMIDNQIVFFFVLCHHHPPPLEMATLGIGNWFFGLKCGVCDWVTVMWLRLLELLRTYMDENAIKSKLSRMHGYVQFMWLLMWIYVPPNRNRFMVVKMDVDIQTYHSNGWKLIYDNHTFFILW